MIVTRVQLAEMKGCTKQAVYDRHFPSEQKSANGICYYDTEHPEIVEWLSSTDGTKKPKTPTKSTEKRSLPEKKATKSPRKPRRPVETEDDDDPDELSELDNLPALERIEKIKNHRFLRAVKSSELVPREMVKAVFARFFTVHTSILIPMSGKIGPEIATSLGITTGSGVLSIQEIIDREMYLALGQIKKTMDESIERIERGETE